MIKKHPSQKTFQELTIKDNFMFAAVMTDPQLCKDVLELILGIPIDHVEVVTEKSFIYHPEYKSIRLDVYAKDEKGSCYDVEMQVGSEHLEKRSRYYHSQMDMDLLVSGSAYNKLPDSFVIFICDFDPFHLGKYLYTLIKRFKESPGFSYTDGEHTIYLNTHGKNPEEVDPKLVRFLNYLKDPDLSANQTQDELIMKLQHSVTQVKKDRFMEGRFMHLEIMLQDERRAGRKEGHEEGLEEGREKGREEGREEERINMLSRHILIVLESKGEVPPDLSNHLAQIRDSERLDHLFREALTAKDIDSFRAKL